MFGLKYCILSRCLGFVSLIVLCSCGGGSSSGLPSGSVQLNVQAAGAGKGTVSSSPAGINCGTTCSASFGANTQVILTAAPAANSSFAGWTGACTGANSTCTVTLNANQQVTANFAATSGPALSVTLAGTGAGTVSSSPAGISCGSTCTAIFSAGTQITLTANPAGNSSFAGWTGGGCSGTSSTCVVTLTASETVKATFNLAQGAPVLTVTLGGTGTVTSSPSGINCPSNCSASFGAGTQVTLTASAGANSYFAGWGGACSGTNSKCVVTLSASQQVTATFGTSPVLSVSLTGTGTVTSSPAGINCPQTCSASFPLMTPVTLTETQGTGFVFSGWGGACSGTSQTCVVTLSTSQQVTATFSPVLSVMLAGTGTGTVTSSPAGINCPRTCSASFPLTTTVTLTETPGTNSTFGGWSVSTCSINSSTCMVTLNAGMQVTVTFNGVQNITALNHIIFLAQENRSFDHYFGALREYWKQKGYPDQPFDGLPQFNPGGQPPTNPGCNPNDPPPSGCVFDPSNPITSYHLITQCIENPSPSWNEAHVDWNYNDQVGQYGFAALNGFVVTAGGDARADKFNDVNGIRAMGYYDGGDLNYYYFMASNFATSDHWFHPVMTRTHPNREYLVAGTSEGYVYPVGTDSKDKALLTATTIFQTLQAANVTWKIYVNPTNTSCGPPYDPHCLINYSYMQFFQWGQQIPNQYPHNIGTIGIANSDYDTDLANGTLPQVALIEPATDAGYDEHPSVSDSAPNYIQRGAKYVSGLINSLMASSSWKDSAFILTWDENGGLYDHVAPYHTVNPDGIGPVDFLPGDVCTQTGGPLCDFIFTGYRVPVIVVSPYTRQNYVSHNNADTTAILKLIETRFNLSPLTQRDAAQIDMTEFFDFTNPAWMTPPNPPVQDTTAACYLNKLP